VVISRGELVEIGGSYRVPEILRESGAVLAEVGTTNRTHLGDYRAALAAAAEPPAGLILKVHTSNYRIEGFTAEVGIEELAALGREHGVPVAHDLGSGCLVDLAARGLPAEPVVRRSVEAGADLVCFSGDKLLGGPQGGILVGRREAVERCRRHPLYRALRPGRLVYGALEATLRLYRGGEEAALAAVPALARLTADPAALGARAGRLAAALAGTAGLAAEAVECASQAGSGSLPARDLPSRGVRVTLAGRPADDLAAALRRGDPAVVARVQDGALLLDVRTLADAEVEEVAAALRRVAGA
jgi:L-seryl-tRNA(Ser) seleniumtransferase